MRTFIKFRIVPVLVIGILVFACTPEYFSADNFNGQVKVNSGLVSHFPQTAREKNLVVNLEKVTQTIKSLYKDKKNVMIVNAAIGAKVYTDESILLSDLIYPDKSRLANNKTFSEICRKNNLDVKRFSESFWKDVDSRDDVSYKTFLSQIKQPEFVISGKTLSKDKIINLKGGRGGSNSEIIPVTIYQPYFTPNYVRPGDEGGNPSAYLSRITTIATATADADEGIGDLAVYNSYGNVIAYSQVLVNDAYCAANPTHIVGVNGVSPYEEGSVTTTNLINPGPEIPVSGLDRKIRQVYINEIKLINHFDRLISFTGNGGGSEMVFTRSDGYLKTVDGQVQADNFFVLKVISRKDINDRKWVGLAVEWDGEWEFDNKEQYFAIYEEDNRNQAEFTGQIKTTVKIDSVPIEANIGFKVTYKSDDAIITQRTYSGSSFFLFNRIDLGTGFRNGWPVRDEGGSVSFTFADRIYTP